MLSSRLPGPLKRAAATTRITHVRTVRFMVACPASITCRKLYQPFVGSRRISWAATRGRPKRACTRLMCWIQGGRKEVKERMQLEKKTRKINLANSNTVNYALIFLNFLLGYVYHFINCIPRVAGEFRAYTQKALGT